MKNKRILLVEPNYKTKYPPLALLKISTFHKKRGDYVYFVKGIDKTLKETKWDIIYITTLFTYYWDTVVKTIKFYKECVKTKGRVEVGGILASILTDELEKETGIKPYFGLWKEVEYQMPDYELLKDFNYMPEWDASIGFATRGCPNNCKFCAVPKIEEKEDIDNYNSIKNFLDIKKRNIILLDNNILRSKAFPKIIEDLIKYGFYKGAKLNNKNRYVDFNQGVDARVLSEEHMKLLSKISIRPLRIAFDSIKIKDIYIEKVLLAKKYGIENLSNYILYNYNDGPKEFYERLRINVELNEKYGLNIYSFPMRFVDLNIKSRNDPKYKMGYKSKWTERELRGVQLILNATHGVVGPKMKYFDIAFGRTYEEFLEIINTRPEEKILYRSQEWLNRPFKKEFHYI